MRMQPQMELEFRPPEHVHQAERHPPLLTVRWPKTTDAASGGIRACFHPPPPRRAVVNSEVGGPEPCSSPRRCKSCRPPPYPNTTHP